jgi:hypothetical protein
MTLEQTVLLYLVGYLVYLGFTAVSLLYSSRKKYSYQTKIVYTS